MAESVKAYWISKLLMPKSYIIGRPGIIISKTSSIFGSRSNQRRMIYNFEAPASSLQREAVKKFGIKQAGEMFYKIGKDIAFRYMAIAKARKMPSFAVPSLIRYLFDNLNAGGFSAATNIDYNSSTKRLVLTGSNNMICRNSGLAHLTAGLVSGFVSFINGENIEAESKCKECPKNCLIIADKSIKEKYLPDLTSLALLKDYDLLNFPKSMPRLENYYSFNDLIRFGRIEIKSGKVLFDKEVIIPTESGCLEIVADYFVNLGRKDILEAGIIKGTEKLFGSLTDNKKELSERLKFVGQVFSAFGWGLVIIKNRENQVHADFINPPITKYGFLYRAFELNGCLNQIFDKSFQLGNIISLNKPNMRIEYNF